MKFTALLCAAALATAGGAAANAQTLLFDSTFEDAKVAPDTWIDVDSIDGWTAGPPLGMKPAKGVDYDIELQNNVAGAPAPTGGKIFVELDSDQNSAMSRTIETPGAYELTYLYSPRPGKNKDTNGIEVLLDGDKVGKLEAETGGKTTDWEKVTVYFTTTKPDENLTFEAKGISDSYGGYIDNIKLFAVSCAPEPSTWALMIAGFGMIGVAFRQAKRKGGSIITATVFG